MRRASSSRSRLSVAEMVGAAAQAPGADVVGVDYRVPLDVAAQLHSEGPRQGHEPVTTALAVHPQRPAAQVLDHIARVDAGHLGAA